MQHTFLVILALHTLQHDAGGFRINRKSLDRQESLWGLSSATTTLNNGEQDLAILQQLLHLDRHEDLLNRLQVSNREK